MRNRPQPTNRPSRRRIRRARSADGAAPRCEASIASTARNTANPQDSDSTMNSGGKSALPYAPRATMKAKIEPVPQVRAKRQTNDASPAVRACAPIRRLMTVQR